MYNIKQAAARAGVSVPVLRAWERRYGIVHPARTAGGYRQFDDASIARVRAMRVLIDEGWSPSAAAASILAGTTSARVGAGQQRADLAIADSAPAEATVLAERFVAAAGSLAPEAVAAVLDDLFSRGSFERVATDLLFPALEALGVAWASGEVSVAAEHLASNAVLHRLGQSLDAAGAPDDTGERVIVGLPPGGRHELGALAFAVAARRAGLPVTYLGPDLPQDDWAMAGEGARAAVIGVIVQRDRAGAVEVAGRLRAAAPDLVIAFGGRASPEMPGTLRLPRGLVEAVATLREALEEPPVPA